MPRKPNEDNEVFDMEELALVENLTKVYKIGQIEYPALRGVSMQIYSGELLAIVGPSGSGKSTLLQIVGGLDRPTKGKVVVDGVDISELNGNKLAEYRNKKIGFVFQFFNLIQYLKAVENVELPLAIAGVGAKTRRSRALELLGLFGLGDKVMKRPSELSGGEQQRVAIARSLVCEPRLILADEPTGNIDTQSSMVVVDAFRKLVDEKNVAIAMVTHNLELTKVCDRTIKLRDGQIVDSGE